MAKRWFRLISVYTLVYGVGMTFLIFAYKREIAALFTQEPQVRALIEKCMPIVAIKFVPHGYQGLLGLGMIPALGM